MHTYRVCVSAGVLGIDSRSWCRHPTLLRRHWHFWGQNFTLKISENKLKIKRNLKKLQSLIVTKFTKGAKSSASHCNASKRADESECRRATESDPTRPSTVASGIIRESSALSGTTPKLHTYFGFNQYSDTDLN